jgi:carbon monoxide dehydrogenase subunit G
MRWQRVLTYSVALLAIMGVMIAIAAVRTTGRAHGEASIVIARPPAAVFAWIADPAKRAAWQSGIKESRPVTPGPLHVGSKVVTVVELNNEITETVAEITALEPDRRLAASSSNASYDMTIRYDLAPEGTGTRLQATTDAELKGWLPRLLAGTVQQNAQQKLEKDLQTLKEKVEKANG